MPIVMRIISALWTIEFDLRNTGPQRGAGISWDCEGEIRVVSEYSDSPSEVLLVGTVNRMVAEPNQASISKSLEVATLAGGCFWCTEAVFDQLKGVVKVESGYSGGNVPDPSYDDVCSGDTGHAESIEVTFDPALISYADLLHIF